MPLNHNSLCHTQFCDPAKSRKSSNLKENQVTAKRCLQAIVLPRVFPYSATFWAPLGKAPFQMHARGRIGFSMGRLWTRS